MPRDSGAREQNRKIRDNVNAIAWLLDSAIRLPGGFRIGVDALIGLIPFLGDAVGVLFSGYVVSQAVRAGAPTSLLLRMAFNVAVEGLVGAVPLLGDFFDAAWKANMRNARLLNQHLDNPRETTRSSRLFNGLLLLALVIFLVGVSALSVLAIDWLRETLR
jgi:hypothetical protein